jgi:hypothetical protein
MQMKKPTLFIVAITSLCGISATMANACTKASIQEIISSKSQNVPASAGQIPTIFTEIASSLQIYHDAAVGRNTGLVTYDVKITNGYHIKGFTVCSCAVFENSADNIRIATLGGRWGINPRQDRAESLDLEVPKSKIKFIDRITIFAGYCPKDISDLPWKEIAKEGATLLIGQ